MTTTITTRGPVTAPCVGVVITAGDEQIWIDAQTDHGLDLVLTGLTGLDVDPGQWVYPGLVVGTAVGSVELTCYTAPGKDGGTATPSPWDEDRLHTLLTTPATPPAGRQLTADIDILTTADSGPRDPATCQLWCLHTDEGDPDGSVDDLLAWQQDPAHESSYTLAVDRTGRIGRGNDDTYRPWSAGPTGNDRGLHLCLKGRATQTTDDWLAQPTQLTAAAHVIADWTRRYRIPLIHRTPDELRTGLRGGCGHLDITHAWNEVTHTDPGAGLPWNHLLHLAARAAGDAG